MKVALQSETFFHLKVFSFAPATAKVSGGEDGLSADSWFVVICVGKCTRYHYERRGPDVDVEKEGFGLRFPRGGGDPNLPLSWLILNAQGADISRQSTVLPDLPVTLRVTIGNLYRAGILEADSPTSWNPFGPGRQS